MVRYSHKAAPYLDAFALAMFASPELRDWLLQGTEFEASYAGAECLNDMQHALRPNTKQPFYVNYWCGRDSRCTCRPPGSKGLETDLMIFLRNGQGRKLGIHIEFKHPKETLSFGQAEAYPMRASCWATGSYRPRSVMAHDDWMTAILCGDDELGSSALEPFQRQMGHRAAARLIPGWPT